jgi:hypothetical protein
LDHSYIISAGANDNGNGDVNVNERKNGSAVGRTLAVGRYDPESGFIDMATWEEVEKFLK